jgi:uncharacterized membrane protein
MASKRSIGERASEAVSRFVGTWKFIFLYTGSMMSWMVLHHYGILHIDSPEFMRWNLWLSYFAGIQASILLMAAERQAARDRKRDDQTHKVTHQSAAMIREISKDIESLEEIVSDLIEEKSNDNRE